MSNPHFEYTPVFAWFHVKIEDPLVLLLKTKLWLGALTVLSCYQFIQWIHDVFLLYNNSAPYREGIKTEWHWNFKI